MKKFISITLCVVMLFLLVSCGQDTTTELPNGDDNENNVTQDRDFISDPEVPDNTNNNVQSETVFVKLKNNIIDKGIYYEKEKKYVCRFTSNMSEINSCQLTYYPSQNMISYDFELSEVETTVEIYSGNEFYVKVNYPENFSFYSAIMKKSEYHNSKDLEENNFVPFCDLDKDKCLELVAVATDKAFGVLSITLQKFDMTLSDFGFTSFDVDYNKTEDKTQNNDAEPNKPNDTETKPNTSTGNQTKPNTSTNTQTKPNTSTDTQTKPNTSTNTETKPNTSVSTQTTGQRNALKRAEKYLSVMAFSYEGLISQLEFEKYSHEDAVYAADNCGADWKEQALKKAKKYLDNMAFSYTGLISQLEFEKYTSEQAKYGADNCGADWNKQAEKKAKKYLDNMAFSRDGLINQLEFEGFTHDQAVYGVTSNGY